MDKQTARRLGDELNEAVRAVAAKYGMEAQPQGGTYTESGLRYKVQLNEVVLNDAGVNTASPEAVEYDRYAHLWPYEIKDEVGVGDTVQTSRGDAVIVGLNTRARTMPLLVRYPDGKRYKMPVPKNIKKERQAARLSEIVMEEVAAEGGFDTRDK